MAGGERQRGERERDIDGNRLLAKLFGYRPPRREAISSKQSFSYPAVYLLSTGYSGTKYEGVFAVSRNTNSKMDKSIHIQLKYISSVSNARLQPLSLCYHIFRVHVIQASFEFC